MPGSFLSSLNPKRANGLQAQLMLIRSLDSMKGKVSPGIIKKIIIPYKKERKSIKLY